MTVRPVLRLACVIVFVLGAVVMAAPRKVMVLPVDGNAEPAVRRSLEETVRKLARGVGGRVTRGDTTFADTAAAVGCDPSQPACADTVLDTLAVDELIWGTATTSNGQTTVVIKRAVKGHVREQSATVDPKAPDAAASALQPLFEAETSAPGGEGTGSTGAETAGSGSAAEGSATGSAAGGSSEGSAALTGSGSAAPAGSGVATSTTATATVAWSHDKKLGLGLAAGGGVALVVGLALWANESDLQGQIDSTPTPTTLQDVQNLRALEDKAGSYATWGDILVVAGLAAGGAGAYYLWRDHQHHVTAVTPAPVDQGTGMSLVVRGTW